MASYDLIVIGAGPGGYVAAIRAQQLGLNTAIVEREHLGGTCLNWGCIPTKALLKTAEMKHHMEHAEEFGLKVEGISFDLKKVVDRSRKIANQLSGGIQHLMKKNKVPVLNGHAKLLGSGKLSVTDDSGKAEIHSAKHIIIATGARARELPNIKPDGKLIWTAKEAMVPESMPESMVIVGSGAIGIEFASFYNAMGCDVTVVELLDRIVPNEDAEISAMAEKAFTQQGIKIMTSAMVESATPTGDSVKVKIKTGGKVEEKTVDRVILAVGIMGNTENLGLEKTKVKVEKGQIEADANGATAEPGIYAIGDVAGAPWLAHKASHEGIHCVEHIAGQAHSHHMSKNSIPGCTYSYPQIASIGMTEAQAKEAGHAIKVGRFPYQGNGKALAMGEKNGLVKTIFDAKTGEFLGAHMIGAEVTELIQGFAIAQTLETTEEELMQTVFPHPTLSEMIHESVLQAYDRAIHI